MTNGSISGTDAPAIAHPNHGRTVAAGAGAVGISLTALIASNGVGTPTWTLAWAGSIVTVASLMAGAVLKALGHGQPTR